MSESVTPSAGSDIETDQEDLTECNNDGCTYGYFKGGRDLIYMNV